MNKMSIHILVILLIISCDNDSQGESDSCQVERFLVTTDSIGVEYGDSLQMLGNVSAVLQVNDSNILVLDTVSGILYQYSICYAPFTRTSLTLRGNGPESLDNPWYLQAIGSGRTGVISNSVPTTYLTLDDDMHVEMICRLDSRGVVEQPVVLNDSTVAGCTYDYRPTTSGAGVIITRSINQWHVPSGEVVNTYRCDEYEIDLDEVNNSYAVKVAMECCLASDVHGNLYFSSGPMSNIVSIYSLDCQYSDSVTVTLLPGSRPDSEIALEIECRKAKDGDLGDWQPSSGYLGVIELHVQKNAGLLWVRHGSRVEPSFDVFSLDTPHEFYFRVTGTQKGEEISTSISDAGYLGFTPCPMYYPIVYIYSLE